MLREEPLDCRGDPSARSAPVGLELHDCALVDLEPLGKLVLGEPTLPPDQADSVAESRPGALGFVSEEQKDPAVVPRERSGTIGFPEMDSLLPDADLSREGSLPNAEVESSPPEVIA